MGSGGQSSHREQGLIRSVDRALAILEALGAAPARGLTLTELASTVSLPPSTTHRLLTSLQGRRFVRFERRTGRWAVGAMALGVGANYAGSRNLVGLALPVMERLAARCGETVNLGVIEEGRVTFLMRVDPRQRRHYVPPSGTGIPIHGSSIGKAILAEMPFEEVSRAISPSVLRPLTGNTIVDRATLLRHIDDTHRRGYAIDDEENTVGLRCLATAVLDEYHCPVAALSLAAPVGRLPDGQFDQRGRMIADGARQLSIAFAGRTA